MEKKKRFEFDLGCIKVNKTLYKPTQDRFCEWLIRYSQLDTHPFRGYLVGGFPSKFDTWDADVCLTNTGSEPADLVKLEFSEKHNWFLHCTKNRSKTINNYLDMKKKISIKDKIVLKDKAL